jgi:LysM repeat protein
MLADLTFWLDRQKGDQMNKQFSFKYWGRMFWVVVVCLSLGLAPSQALAYRSPARLAGSVLLAIDPPTITVVPGQVFTLRVLVQAGAQQVDGAEAHLDFDSGFMRARTHTRGPTLSTILEENFDTPGRVDYAAGTLINPRPSGTFTLVEIEFEALAVTPGTPVTFHFGIPRNSEVTFGGASVLGGTSNAAISVQQTGAGAAPFTPPLGAQVVGLSGGVFTCAQWSMSIPAGVVPNGGAIHCGGFNPNVAPPAPAGFQLLRHTINVNIYNNSGGWITTFNPSLTLCRNYGDADRTAAGGNPDNLVIQTAPIGGVWTALATTVDTSAQRICARVSALSGTLFDLSARGPVSPPRTYQVRSGDNLFRIALRYGTTVEAIRAANWLTSNAIYPGQVLVIPSGASANSSSPSSPAPAPRSDPIPPGNYIVQPGDTLYRIALRAGMTMQAIQAANGMTTVYVHVGQALVIPAARAPITTAPGSTRTYTVQSGDNLFRIALRFGTTVEAIQAANELTGTDIHPGQVLIIPGS